MHTDETDRTNALAKLAMHRIVARELGRGDRLVDSARRALDAMEDRIGHTPYMDEWRDILSGPSSEVRRKITGRDEDMDRLRISSPFLADWQGGIDFRDPALRTRIWRLAKRVANLRVRREPECATGMRAA
jgi:hypothetical protein